MPTCVVWHIGRAMEESVNSVSTVGSHHGETAKVGMLRNDIAHLPVLDADAN